MHDPEHAVTTAETIEEGKALAAELDEYRYCYAHHASVCTKTLIHRLPELEGSYPEQLALFCELLGVYGSCLRIMGELDRASATIREALSTVRAEQQLPKVEAAQAASRLPLVEAEPFIEAMQRIEGRLLLRHGIVDLMRGNYVKAIELERQAGHLFLDLEDWRRIGECLVNLAAPHYYLCNLDKCRENAGAALNLLTTDNHRLRCTAYNWLSIVYQHHNDPGQAESYHSKATAEATDLHDHAFVVRIRGNLAQLAGNLEAAAQHYQEATTALKNISPLEAFFSTLSLIETLLYLNRTQDAIAAIHEAVAFAPELQRASPIAETVLIQMRNYLARGISPTLRMIEQARRRTQGR